jgi:hypothetical protein
VIIYEVVAFGIPRELAELSSACGKIYRVACYAIGETGGDRLRIRWNGETLIDLPLEQCRAAYEGAIPRWFGQA